MATRWWTYRKDVPLIPGFLAAFRRGKGWFERKASTPQIRTRLASLMDGTVKNEPNWHYDAVRPLVLPTEAQALNGKVISDCSFGCSILCNLAPAADPTGDNWQGNSTSMFNRLPHITKVELKVGDMAVFGTQGRLHAMMVRDVSSDPLMWSHGQEAGPVFVKLSAEVAYHAQRYTDGNVVTYLRLAV